MHIKTNIISDTNIFESKYSRSHPALQAEVSWSLFVPAGEYPASRGFLVLLCSGRRISNLCVKPSDFLSCMCNIRHTHRHFRFLHICTSAHASGYTKPMNSMKTLLVPSVFESYF